MKTMCYTIVVLVCLFLTEALFSQEYANIRHYTTQDGMISNRVYSIAQDESGFVWLATDFGLERFDGQMFKHYRQKDYPALPREDFLFVHYLGNGKLAMGGYQGLFVEYDTHTDQFRNVMPSEFNESFYKETIGILGSYDSSCYAYTNCGVYPFVAGTNSFEATGTVFEATKSLYVATLYKDERRRFWVGSMDSLFVFSANGKRLHKYVPKSGACSFVRSMLPLTRDRLLVASQSHEFWVYDLKNEKPSDPQILTTPFSCVTKIIRSSNGRYWIATDGDGLWYTDDSIHLHTKYHNLVPYNSDPDEVRKIYSLMEDRSGNIWFGTQNSGLWCYKGGDPTGVAFSVDYGFPSAVCSSFSEDDSGNLLVSVDGGGVYTVDTCNRIHSVQKFDNNNIPSMARTTDGKLYIATWGDGVYSYSLKSKSGVHRESFDGIANPIANYFGIHCPNGKDVYACSSGDGLYVKREKENRWRHVVLSDEMCPTPNKWVFKVVQGKDNVVWILTTHTLWYVKGGNARSLLHEENSNKKHNPFIISDMETDPSGNLFCATNEGVVRISVRSFEMEKLLFVPEASYKIIQMDDDGMFWVAGNSGIYSFDYAKKSSRYLPVRYTNKEATFFYNRAGYKSSDGVLHFGTNDGYLNVNPKQLDFNMEIPLLRFSELYVSGEKRMAGQCLNECAPAMISFPHDSTNISVSVDVIDFSEMNRVRCSYRLLGLQNEWKEMSSRTIDFSYLPSGDYQLCVKAYRGDDGQTSKEITLGIRVLAPWWRTWWAYTLLVGLLIGMVTLFFWYRLRNMEAKKNELDTQVKERTKDLEVALKEKDQLISVIGHDLKNPMFAIVSTLENWLKKEESLDKQQKHSLIEGTFQSAQTLQNEMVKLLDWAHSKSADIVCRPEEVDIKLIVDSAVHLAESLLSKKNISCVRDIEYRHLATVDPRMISSVVRNLLVNAIKYTHEGGEIRIDGTEDESQLILKICDNGVGISAERLAQLQQPVTHQSTKGTNQESGTGLGLNICYEYIRQNKGTMEIASEEGKGTAITLRMPLSDRLMLPEENTSEEEPSTELEENEEMEGNTVLIVDDNELLCEDIRLILSDYLTVLVAHDGAEALRLIEKENVDILLSDVEMPTMDGMTLCRRVQETKPYIPTLFLSGRTEERYKLKGLGLGAIDYITKPFSQKELVAKIKSILKIRRQQQEHILSIMMERGEYPDVDAENRKVEETTVVANPFIERLMERIRETYMQSEMSIDDLANAMNVSRATLFRRTKSLVGKSPVELLGEYRLNEAKRQLVSNSELSVNEVAYAVGFSDPSYFGKRFKEYFGITPKQIRK